VGSLSHSKPHSPDTALYENKNIKTDFFRKYVLSYKTLCNIYCSWEPEKQHVLNYLGETIQLLEFLYSNLSFQWHPLYGHITHVSYRSLLCFILYYYNIHLKNKLRYPTVVKCYGSDLEYLYCTYKLQLLNDLVHRQWSVIRTSLDCTKPNTKPFGIFMLLIF